MSRVHDIHLVVQSRIKIWRGRHDMELYVEDTEACYVEVGEQSLSCGGVKGRSEDSVKAAILGITQYRCFSSPGVILK